MWLYKTPQTQILEYEEDSLGSSIGTVNKLRTEKVGVRFPAGVTNYFSHPKYPDIIWNPSSLISNKYLQCVLYNKTNQMH